MRHRLYIFVAATMMAMSTFAEADDKMDLDDTDVASFALGYLFFVEAGVCEKLTLSDIRFETRLKN